MKGRKKPLDQDYNMLASKGGLQSAQGNTYFMSWLLELFTWMLVQPALDKGGLVLSRSQGPLQEEG